MTLTLPITFNASDGFVVPIPILFKETTIKSVSLLTNPNLLQAFC